MNCSTHETGRDVHGTPVNVFFDEPAHLERDRRTLEFLDDCWTAGREAVVATVMESEVPALIAIGDRLFVTSAGAAGPLLSTPLEHELLRHARACLSESRSRGVALGACEVWFEWAAAPMPVVIVEEPAEIVAEALPETVVVEFTEPESKPAPRRTGFAAVLNKGAARRASEAAIHIVRPPSTVEAAVSDIRSKLRAVERSLREPPELPALDSPETAPPDRFPLFRTA